MGSTTCRIQSKRKKKKKLCKNNSSAVDSDCINLFSTNSIRFYNLLYDLSSVIKHLISLWNINEQTSLEYTVARIVTRNYYIGRYVCTYIQWMQRWGGEIMRNVESQLTSLRSTHCQSCFKTWCRICSVPRTYTLYLTVRMYVCNEKV